MFGWTVQDAENQAMAKNGAGCCGGDQAKACTHALFFSKIRYSTNKLSTLRSA